MNVTFSLLSSREIYAQSVLEITHATQTKKEPYPGVWNNLQGPIGLQTRCGTCGLGADECILGHWAHVKFSQPIPRSLYADRTVLIAQCICFNCSLPLATRDRDESTTMQWLRNLRNVCVRVKTCTHCGSEQPTWKLNGNKRSGCITVEWHEPVSPMRLYAMVSGIRDEDLVMFDLHPIRSRPESLFWTVFPIMPTPMRPMKQAKTGSTALFQMDDSTTRLKSIVRLKDPGEVDLRKPSRAYTNLCSAVASFCDSRATTSTYGRALRSIRDNFSKDFSLMRDMIMSKRGDYIARSVITVDSSLHIRDVGVPRWMTRKLTVPVRVCRVTAPDLAKELRDGNVPYIHTQAGVLEKTSGATRLEMGMTAERCLRNGDLVLMNRQPTLHTHSMMAHRVRVMDGSVLRIHLAVTPAYNADFDGDEMNLYVVRGEMARAEAQELMLVDHMILKDGVPIIRFSQSVICGLYILSDPETTIESDVAAQILSPWTNVQPRDGTGRAMLECITPIPFGRLDAKSLNSRGGLISQMLDAYGDTRTLDWMTALYNISETYISSVRPVSITLDDCFVARGVIGHSCPEEGEGTEGPEQACFYKAEADRVSDRAANALSGSSLSLLVASGTKGTNENVHQIAGCIGLQFDHKQKAYKDGFIASNFALGLTPTDMFLHLKAARVGLMDTSARTRETGYLNRKLARCTEDLFLAPDNTVRNGTGCIVSWHSSGTAGDMVGQLASQAIGEQLTQSNLRTFHVTGQEHGLRSGVGRVIAVLEARDLVPRIAEAYGVDTARDYIIHELTAALEAAGATVDYKHVRVLADAMTYTGSVKPLNFFGTPDSSVLLRSSFERCFEVFFDAAYRGLRDGGQTLTGAVTLGQSFTGGTSLVSVLRQDGRRCDDGARPYSPPSFRPSSPYLGEEIEGRADSPSYRPSSPSYRPSSPPYAN